MAEIAAAVGGRADPAWGGAAFRGFQFDSRVMKPGMLFFALRGAQTDGHDHVRELRTVPGAGAVVRRDFKAGGWKLPLLRVADPLRAAQDLAAHVRGKYGHIRYVGITGSAGKTTTKEFLYQILSSRQRCFRAPRNWNNWIGLPFSLLQLSGREKTAVFELAMSDPGRGEIDRLAAILKPDVALLLNVFPVHLEFLKTLANAARAKGEILGHLAADSCAFVNGDQPLLRRVAAAYRGRIVFSVAAPGATTSCSRACAARRKAAAWASISSASRRTSWRR
jgi:UDP-N-acetylmuramyl pentapeptide synthase